MTRFFAITIPAMFVVTLAGWVSAEEITPTQATCPANSAVAKSVTIKADGTIVIHTRCVVRSR